MVGDFNVNHSQMGPLKFILVYICLANQNNLQLWDILGIFRVYIPHFQTNRNNFGHPIINHNKPTTDKNGDDLRMVNMALGGSHSKSSDYWPLAIRYKYDIIWTLIIRLIVIGDGDG